MSDARQINPKRREVRGALRAVGLLATVVGLVLVAIGLSSFFSATGSFGSSRYFWCAIVGLPILGVGLMISKFAFLGAVARYVAGEGAPVAKDTFNYMAEGTREGVEALAGAMGRGLSSAGGPTMPRIHCPKCNEENDRDANFCAECGEALRKSSPCAQCGELNDPDAKFCDNCGSRIS